MKYARSRRPSGLRKTIRKTNSLAHRTTWLRSDLLMAPDAVIIVAVYPGHAEGEAEGREICEYLSGLSRYKICATQIKILNSPTSPFFIVIENKP